MKKLIVCFAPHNTEIVRQDLSEIPCTINREEIGKAFPSYFHITCNLKAYQIQKLVTVDTIVFEVEEDPDSMKKNIVPLIPICEKCGAVCNLTAFLPVIPMVSTQI